MPRAPRVAATTERLTLSVFEALGPRLAAHRGVLHRLSVGDAWREPHPSAHVDSLRAEDHPLLHAYAPTHGEPALLDAIGERLAGRVPGGVPRDQVQVVSGATGGLSACAQALLEPGDEVILPSPFWPLVAGLLRSRGALDVQVPVFTRLDDPVFDLEATLEAAVTARTSALYLNALNNPTGRVLGEDDLAAVARVAERHDLWVLSDEVYEDLWYEQPPPAAAWVREDLRHRTVAVHSLSKSHALAGARVGWAHGPAAAMRAVRAVQVHQYYCAARPVQLAAARALREAGGWVEETRALYAAAARRVGAVLGVRSPAAGTFAFVEVAAHLGDAGLLAFLERCVDAGVLLTPGTASGAAFGAHVRLCFTTVPPEELEDALQRLAGVLEATRR